MQTPEDDAVKLVQVQMTSTDTQEGTVKEGGGYRCVAGQAGKRIGRFLNNKRPNHCFPDER